MDFDTRVALLEPHLHAELDGPEPIEEGREKQQLSDGCQDGTVNDAHRWDEEAAYYQTHRNEKRQYEG